MCGDRILKVRFYGGFFLGKRWVYSFIDGFGLGVLCLDWFRGWFWS